MVTICFVLCDNMLATSLVLPLEMLHAANDHVLGHKQHNTLSITTISDNNQPVRTRGGLPVIPDQTLEGLDGTPDYIYIPALWRNPQKTLRQHRPIVDWLALMAERGASICAASTGACFLAESGLLDHKPATTHWFYFDKFQQLYPAVALKRQHLITQAGQLYCAGSVNALADLTVHFIGQMFDKSVSTHVERHFSHEARQPFEQITFLDERPSRHQDEEIIQAQLWLHENFSQQIKLSELAEDFDMSMRTFNRRFKTATGKTPLNYLQELRISNARDLLKNSNLSITEIAQGVGYQDMAHFSGLFKKIMQVTPSEFRKTVRSKLFSLGIEA